MNKKGMSYTNTQEQREAVKSMFNDMTPSCSRNEILFKLGIKNKKVDEKNMARKTPTKALQAPTIELEGMELDAEGEDQELTALRNKVADLEELLQQPPDEDPPDGFFNQDVEEEYPRYAKRQPGPLRPLAPVKATMLDQVQAVVKWVFNMIFNTCAVIFCVALAIVVCFIPIGAFEVFSVHLLRFMGVHV